MSFVRRPTLRWGGVVFASGTPPRLLPHPHGLARAEVEAVLVDEAAFVFQARHRIQTPSCERTAATTSAVNFAMSNCASPGARPSRPRRTTIRWSDGTI